MRDSDGLSEIADLKSRLAEAEDTLRALRSGEVDAFVVDGESGPQVFTLKSAAEPYRLLVEQMREGAVTLSVGGVSFIAMRPLPASSARTRRTSSAPPCSTI